MHRFGVFLGLAVAAAAVVAVVFVQTRSGDEGEPPSLDELKTGVGRVEILNCDGTPFRVRLGGPAARARAISGSGFLVGSRVVMSAEHGLWAGQRRGRLACKLRVRFGDETYPVTGVHVWSERGEADRQERRKIDLMTLALAHPADGHVFQFAREGAGFGTSVATLGYPGGGPLRLTRGEVTGSVVDDEIPSLAAKMKIEGGNSGGPIFNDRGEVLSVVSRLVIAGTVTEDRSNRCRRDSVCSNWGGVELPRWWGDDAVPDLCSLYPGGGVPGCGDRNDVRTAKVPIEIQRG